MNRVQRTLAIALLCALATIVWVKVYERSAPKPKPKQESPKVNLETRGQSELPVAQHSTGPNDPYKADDPQVFGFRPMTGMEQPGTEIYLIGLPGGDPGPPRLLFTIGEVDPKDWTRNLVRYPDGQIESKDIVGFWENTGPLLWVRKAPGTY